MEAFIANLKTYLKTLPRKKLYLYLGLLVGIVGGSAIALSFIQKEEYSTLFSGLDTEDASMVVAKLKEQKVPYKLGANGTVISVPREKVYDVRLNLASQNSLPGSAGVGMELFDKTNYGMTEFMQNINYKRAIQGELTRTINQMPEIKGSRVHIVIPEKTLFTEKEKEATASIFLKLKPGKDLSREEVNGIVQLVAGSIEGLKADNVVVIDSAGRILHKSGETNSGFGLSTEEYEVQRNVEKKIEDSVQSMLQTFLVTSKSVVRASVDLNLRKEEKTEEEYSPDKTAVSSQKKVTEKSVSTKGKPSGVPGAEATAIAAEKKIKQRAGIPPQPGEQNLNQSEREDNQVEYEVSKTVRKIIEPYGDIKRISLAVLVDGKYEKVMVGRKEQLKYVPRSQQELNNIKALVFRAAGLNDERGDKIEVLNMPFEAEDVPETGIFDNPGNKELILNLGRYAFYLIMALCVFFFVFRPFLKGSQKKEEEAVPLQKVKDVYVKGSGPEAAAIPPGSEAEQQQRQMKPTAQGQPALAEAFRDTALVGSVIREWVKEGG